MNNEILKLLSDNELDNILKNGKLVISSNDVKKEMKRRNNDYKEYEKKYFLYKDDFQINVIKTDYFVVKGYDGDDTPLGEMPFERIDFRFSDENGMCYVSKSEDSISKSYYSFFKSFETIDSSTWKKYLEHYNKCSQKFNDVFNL